MRLYLCAVEVKQLNTCSYVDTILCIHIHTYSNHRRNREHYYNERQ